LKFRRNIGKTAKEMMDPKVVVISEEFNQEEIQAALEASEYKNFPVVLNKETMILIGTVERRNLEDYVYKMSNPQEEVRTLYSQQEALPDMNETSAGLTITSIPIQVSEDTPLSQIHMLFINLRLFQAFVTKNGKLLGIIKRKKLREVLDETNNVFTYLRE
jgi:predicted transcriptional regulator